MRDNDSDTTPRTTTRHSSNHLFDDGAGDAAGIAFLSDDGDAILFEKKLSTLKGGNIKKIENRDDAVPPAFGKRHQLALLSFAGFAIVYALRVNLSVAIVSMVHRVHDDDGSNITERQAAVAAHDDSRFDWPVRTQGMVLGSFFYGYWATQLPGGWFAQRHGATSLLGYAILATGLLTLVTPWAAHSQYGANAVIVLRIAEGLCEGVCFPALTAMWSQWAPKFEVSKLNAISHSGASLGTVLTFPLAGLLGQTFGWPSIFYSFGLAACVWFIAWHRYAYNSPLDHPTITFAERRYIVENRELHERDRSTPWRFILTSPPLLALYVVDLLAAWPFYTLLVELPTYMSTVIGVDLRANGLLSAIPYLAAIVVMQILSFLADYLRRHAILSTACVRRCCEAIASFGPAIVCLLLPSFGTSLFSALCLLIAAVGLSGASLSGHTVSPIDIMPSHAGIVYGIMNTCASFSGCLAPSVTSYLTGEERESPEAWRRVFYLCAATSAAAGIVFIIFARGEPLNYSDRTDVTANGEHYEAVNQFELSSRSVTNPDGVDSDDDEPNDGDERDALVRES